MKKVAILTINDYSNYGNRLQNYATQEILKSIGFSVETIIHEVVKPNPWHNVNKFSRLNKIKEMSVAEILSKTTIKLSNYFNKRKLSNLRENRIQSFKEFTNTFIKETNFSISDKKLPNDLSNQYDFFITGSDQVWNPYFRYGSSIDFLAFAPQDKRIAYAPSFGISQIPPEYVDRYKQWLSDIPYLSVREHAGAKIIKDLTGRDAVVLVDPTLMLTKEKWLSIAKPAKTKPKKKYLLTYFLGGIPKEYNKKIDRIAKENELQIINLVDIKDPETYITGPSEFIDFIHSASIFCTDSFHGVVFSILMETPFIVFERAGDLPSMNSRIETILSTFKLEARHVQNIRKEEIFEADYTHVWPILEAERKKAFDYLKEALNVH
ncbi:polysaccharide pyruvyl transferase family protein [Calidifontibacillus erzurumensis]|uniref:Polysaccharide pyruvyl transferase family protein n=1 Tax=Calidifontibacillus erzurumensis TaxID=2741433 RepID=A0A8J8GHY9_9BACI|nr:polysaccharide pyruvyl transferase family protein [Calidifontibacillus erzurumensis]NSL52728.1 polysaccharide pyruvyl transferase family protein [Calidifontibacillus erzurumensis]